MTENSPAGLTLFAPDRVVVVTREEHHRTALNPYAPHADGLPRKVVVELGIAPIEGARHRGGRGVEIRLEGQRVGELSAPMAARYAGLVEDVLNLGARPACIAQVVNGRRGVQVELRLPAVAVGAAVDPEPPLHLSIGAPSAPPRARRRTPYLVGAGVAALLIVIGTSAGRDRDSTVPTADGRSVPAATTTAAPAPRSATPASTVRRTTAAPPPIPAPAAAPAPRPAPEPEPEASYDCDPNYADCVPVADDVDCADGGDDGPVFVAGPVEITGTDVYDLDPDDDGTACD